MKCADLSRCPFPLTPFILMPYNWAGDIVLSIGKTESRKASKALVKDALVDEPACHVTQVVPGEVHDFQISSGGSGSLELN